MFEDVTEPGHGAQPSSSEAPLTTSTAGPEQAEGAGATLDPDLASWPWGEPQARARQAADRQWAARTATLGTPDDEWAWPGRPPLAPPPPEPDACARQLVAVTDALLAQAPGDLTGPVALERLSTVLTQLGRLEVVASTALADVSERELFALDGAGSASGWLRRQACGDAGRAARSRRFTQRPGVAAAVATGALGVPAADVVCRALEQLPASCAPGQVEGVLQNAVPELLSRWTAGPHADPDVTTAREQLVERLVADGLAADHLPPAERLEPAFTLVGQALSVGVLAEQLEQLVDALQPLRLEDAEAAAHDERRLQLRRKRRQPGWRLLADLTDEVGEALHAELQARAAARTRDQERMDAAREAAQEDVSLFGTVGPGTPRPPDVPAPLGPDGWTPVASGPVPLTDEQLAHDLLGELLTEAACRHGRPDGPDDQPALSPCTPRPFPILITATLDAVEGRLGALPGTVLTPSGSFPLSASSLRRVGCDGLLSAVLLDAARTPIGASGEHRHATARERRALLAKWGIYCAGDGCGSTLTVPHHVDPWWKSGRTRLKDLIPLCKGNHWQLHNGHRVLLLRDGRMIDENGWYVPPDHGPPGGPPRG